MSFRPKQCPALHSGEIWIRCGINIIGIKIPKKFQNPILSTIDKNTPSWIIIAWNTGENVPGN